MIPLSDPEKKLEQAIHGVLRALPPRRAPASLEQRVFAELMRQAALPWWRKSFVHWPVGVRVAFVLLCAGVMRLLFSPAGWTAAGVDGAQLGTIFATPLAWIEGLRTVGGSLWGFFEIMQRNIPSLWLYAAVAVIGFLYATLFGLGAAAYKALRGSR